MRPSRVAATCGENPSHSGFMWAGKTGYVVPFFMNTDRSEPVAHFLAVVKNPMYTVAYEPNPVSSSEVHAAIACFVTGSIATETLSCGNGLPPAALPVLSMNIGP